MYPSRNGLPQRLLLATAQRSGTGHPKKSASSNRHHATARVAYAPTTTNASIASQALDGNGNVVYGAADGVYDAIRGQQHYSASSAAPPYSHPYQAQQGQFHPIPPHRSIRRPAENGVRPHEAGQVAGTVQAGSRSSPLALVAPPAALHLGPVGLVIPFSNPIPAAFTPHQIFQQSSSASTQFLDQNLLASDALLPGTVVEFHTDGTDHRLGLITECMDDSGDVFWVSEPATHGSASPSGQRMVSNKDVTFVWSRKHRNVVFEYTLENLPPLIKHANQLIQQNRSQIPVVWGSYVDSQRSSIQTLQLAEFLFGAQPKPHELYVAHRLLQESKVYFKQSDRYSYFCRSLQEVQQEKKILQQRQREEQDIAQFVQRLQRRLAQTLAAFDGAIVVDSVSAPALDWNPARDQPYIDLLKSYALSTPLHPPLESTWASMLKPLSIGRQPDKVFNMLVQLGIMHKYENPHVARFPRKLDFDTNELKQYAQMSALLDQSMPPSIPTPSIPSAISLPRFPVSVDRDAGHRRDLRSVGPAFAIDNAAGSDEIDDAIGLEQRSDGTTWVHVHIGDPSRLVAPDDELDILARQRAQSIFLPERAITMFPPSLARNQFSLLPGKLNFALSYSFHLNHDGDIVEYEITPSLIDQVHCLTYDSADELLTSNPNAMSATKRQHAEVLRKMVAISAVHREKRISRGACVLDIPRAEIVVMNRGEEIEHKVVRDSSSPSRNMVSEFMILVGELTAKFAAKNNVPIPMRSQASRRTGRDSEIMESAGEWTTTLNQLDHMSRLCAAQTETEPRPHAGLAVDMYCQTTSPIRRYLDLLVHYQIKAALRGDTLPFDRRAVQRLIAQLEQVGSELSRLTSNSQRYWMLRYLERQPQGRVYTALVTGSDFSTDPPGSNLLVVELGWRTSSILDRAPNRGDLLKLYISFIDAFSDVVRFREVLNAQPADTL